RRRTIARLWTAAALAATPLSERTSHPCVCRQSDDSKPGLNVCNRHTSPRLPFGRFRAELPFARRARVGSAARLCLAAAGQDRASLAEKPAAGLQSLEGSVADDGWESARDTRPAAVPAPTSTAQRPATPHVPRSPQGPFLDHTSRTIKDANWPTPLQVGRS